MLFRIFMAFLRTGFFGFGGGAAIAPAMYKEVVDKNHWVDSDAFRETLALSNALPGPAAPQMAAIIGYKTSGISGALVAVLAMIVPMAVFIVWVINWVFSAVGESASKMLILKKSTVAIFPLVAAMLLGLMGKFYVQASSSMGKERTVFLSLLCLGLLVLGVDNGFVILAMISLVITAGAPWKNWVKYLMVLPVGFFLGLHSSLPRAFGISSPKWLLICLPLFLFGVGLWGLWAAPKGENGPKTSEKPLFKAIIRDLAVLWALAFGFSALAMAVYPVLRSGAFLSLMGWMALTGLAAFGGGPVFIPLAISLLAGPGSRIFLYSKERLMQYIAIINALPSPIITKLSALSGWDLVHVLACGAKTGGGVPPLPFVLKGPDLAATGAFGAAMMVAVMVLPAVTNALLAFSCLDRIKKSPAMASVTKFILPVLTAIFLQVFFSFMSTAYSTVKAMPGHTGLSASLNCLGLFGVFFFLRSSKLKVSDPLLILCAVLYGISVL